MQKLKTCLKTSRRFFLRSTAFAAAAAMAPAAPELSAQAPTMAQHAATKGARLASPVTLVSILQGPDSTPAFSHGNTLPVAARPFGMAHWTLQTKLKLSWMFQPGQRRIQGFRSTHQLTPSLGDYGHATFLPVERRTLRFRSTANSEGVANDFACYYLLHSLNHGPLSNTKTNRSNLSQLCGEGSLCRGTHCDVVHLL